MPFPWLYIFLFPQLNLDLFLNSRHIYSTVHLVLIFSISNFTCPNINLIFPANWSPSPPTQLFRPQLWNVYVHSSVIHGSYMSVLSVSWTLSSFIFGGTLHLLFLEPGNFFMSSSSYQERFSSEKPFLTTLSNNMSCLLNHLVFST